jgi:integrase
MKHAEYSLYKKHCGKRVIWYVRFWDYDLERFNNYRSTGIVVTGRRGGYFEAEKTAQELAKLKHTAVGMSAAEFVSAFWQPESRYNQEKIMYTKKPYSSGYLYINQNIVETYIKKYDVFNKIALGELTKGIICDYRIHLYKQGKSENRINTIMQTLSVPINDTFDRGEITTNPILGVKELPVTRKEKGILSSEEIEEIKKLDINCELKAAVYLGLYSGLRVGEVRGLMWDDIADDVINVAHNFQTKDGLKNPKYDSFGKVPLNAETKALLSQLKHVTNYVFSGKKKPHGYTWFYEGIQDVLNKVGVDRASQKSRRLTFHSLRHTFATTSQMDGLSQLETMAILRHKHPNMTAKYTHPKQDIDVVLKKFKKGAKTGTQKKLQISEKI